MKTIVMFGGSGGLGTALKPLLEKKYNVISLSSKDVDVTKIEEVHTIFEGIEHIDIVLNLVGINHDVKWADMDDGHWSYLNHVLDVNLKGHMHVVAGSIAHMMDQKYGRIIGISSVLSEINIPATGIYSTTKAAIDKMYQTANKESMRYGITCNTIQLGYWEVGMIEELSPEFQEQVKKSIGLRRWGKIEELYNAIDFIINTEYYCGNNMKLNGGI